MRGDGGWGQDVSGPVSVCVCVCVWACVYVAVLEKRSNCDLGQQSFVYCPGLTEPRRVTYPVFVFRIVRLHTECYHAVHWRLSSNPKRTWLFVVAAHIISYREQRAASLKQWYFIFSYIQMFGNYLPHYALKKCRHSGSVDRCQISGSGPLTSWNAPENERGNSVAAISAGQTLFALVFFQNLMDPVFLFFNILLHEVREPQNHCHLLDNSFSFLL